MCVLHAMMANYNFAGSVMNYSLSGMCATCQLYFKFSSLSSMSATCHDGYSSILTCAIFRFIHRVVGVLHAMMASYNFTCASNLR